MKINTAIEILLFFKRNAAIMYEDSITMGSKRPGSQAAQVCSNILGKCYFMLVLSVRCCLSKATITGDRWTLLWPDKTGCHSRPWSAPIWIYISVCISSNNHYRFNTNCFLVYLAIPALILCLSPFPTRFSDLPILLHTKCCAKSSILMVVVSQSTLSHPRS